MTLSSEQREEHYTVEFDEREGWLVITDPGGASAIVAENVAPWFGRFVVRVVGPVPNLWDVPKATPDSTGARE